MKVVLIAVNALESALVDEFELPNLKLEDRSKLAIPAGYPLHTEVLWPTIITGLAPDEHGLTRTSAREWENPVLEYAATYSTKIIPERVLLPIGRQIQKLGFGRESNTGAEYYAEQGIETIFTGVSSVDIDIPGYSDRSGTDEIRELMGHSAYEPTDEELFRRKCREEFKSKRVALFDALDTDVELVACYFQTLDNLQHVYWTDREFIEQWYRRFDDLVGEVRDALEEEDEIIIMSDHGMQRGADGKGEHSDHGYCASTVPLEMESLLDLPTALDGLFSQRLQTNQA
jgi:predicted AlkP superfamily pyrophosphatase or phosphodiesterase